MIARIARTAAFAAAILAVCGFDRCGEPDSPLGWLTVSTDHTDLYRTLAVIGGAPKDHLFTAIGGAGEAAWEVGAVEPGNYFVVGSVLHTPMERDTNGEEAWPMQARVTALATTTATVSKRARTTVHLASSQGGSLLVRIPSPRPEEDEPSGVFITLSARPVQVLKENLPSRQVFDSGPVTWTMARVGGTVRIDGIPPGTYQVGIEGGAEVKVPYSNKQVVVENGGLVEVVAGE